MNILIYENGTAVCGDKTYQCGLGKCGLTNDKKEGDGATPIGRFPIRKIFYRKDKVGNLPQIAFLAQEITPNDGWCDDSSSPHYNTYTVLPSTGSHEKLWRDDDVYDIVVILGHNDSPPVPMKGSAIFIHIAREGYTPTEGCISFSRHDLLEILTKADQSTQICIQNEDARYDS